MERQQETDYIRAEGEQIPEDAHSGDHVYSEKMVCIEFRENGKCAFGDRCRFIHTDLICIAFRDDGKCNFGNACRYYHVKTEQ